MTTGLTIGRLCISRVQYLYYLHCYRACSSLTSTPFAVCISVQYFLLEPVFCWRHFVSPFFLPLRMPKSARCTKYNIQRYDLGSLFVVERGLYYGPLRITERRSGHVFFLLDYYCWNSSWLMLYGFPWASAVGEKTE